MRRFMILLATGVIGFLAERALHSQTPAPDLVVYNGKIVTVDGAFSVAQAASIRAGKFAMVGTDTPSGKSWPKKVPATDILQRTSRRWKNWAMGRMVKQRSCCGSIPATSATALCLPNRRRQSSCSNCKPFPAS